MRMIFTEFRVLDGYLFIIFILLIEYLFFKPYKIILWEIFKLNNLAAAILSVLSLLINLMWANGLLTSLNSVFLGNYLIYLFLFFLLDNSLILFLLPKLRGSVSLTLVICFLSIIKTYFVPTGTWVVPLPNTYGSTWINLNPTQPNIEFIIMYVFVFCVSYFFKKRFLGQE